MSDLIYKKQIILLVKMSEKFDKINKGLFGCALRVVRIFSRLFNYRTGRYVD